MGGQFCLALKTGVRIRGGGTSGFASIILDHCSRVEKVRSEDDIGQRRIDGDGDGACNITLLSKTDETFCDDSET